MPPSGSCMEGLDGSRALHRELGAVLRERFQGWIAAVLTGAPELGLELGLRAHRTHSVWNGAIECRMLRIKVVADSAGEPGTLGKGAARLVDTPEAGVFANPLGQTQQSLPGSAERQG